MKVKKPDHKSVKSDKQLFLLCLDNVERVIKHDRDEFRKLLANFYDSCPNLKIILTSCRDIGQLPN